MLAFLQALWNAPLLFTARLRWIVEWLRMGVAVRGRWVLFGIKRVVGIEGVVGVAFALGIAFVLGVGMAFVEQVAVVGTIQLVNELRKLVSALWAGVYVFQKRFKVPCAVDIGDTQVSGVSAAREVDGFGSVCWFLLEVGFVACSIVVRGAERVQDRSDRVGWRRPGGNEDGLAIVGRIEGGKQREGLVEAEGAAREVAEEWERRDGCIGLQEGAVAGIAATGKELDWWLMAGVVMVCGHGTSPVVWS